MVILAYTSSWEVLFIFLNMVRFVGGVLVNIFIHRLSWFCMKTRKLHTDMHKRRHFNYVPTKVPSSRILKLRSYALFFFYWMEIVYGSHNLHCWHFHFYSIVIVLVSISEHFSIWFVNQVSFLMIFGQSFWLLLCVRCTIYVYVCVVCSHCCRSPSKQ